MKHSRQDYQNRIVDLLNIIPEDEPVFLLRAKDCFFIPALIKYRTLIQDANPSPDSMTKELLDSIEAHINSARAWQEQNNEAVKMPTLPFPEDVSNQEQAIKERYAPSLSEKPKRRKKNEQLPDEDK